MERHMRIGSRRIFIMATVFVPLGACDDVQGVQGRPASAAEAAAMAQVVITLQPRELKILSRDEQDVDGCEIIIDERWGMVLPKEGSSTNAEVPVSSFRDNTGSSPTMTPLTIVRLQMQCPDSPRPRVYTGKKAANSPTVVPWIWPRSDAPSKDR
jgi:hypothetical protein